MSGAEDRIVSDFLRAEAMVLGIGAPVPRAADCQTCGECAHGQMLTASGDGWVRCHAPIPESAHCHGDHDRQDVKANQGAFCRAYRRRA